MGCSPSKGHRLSGVQSPISRGRTLLPGLQEGNGESQSEDAGSGDSSSPGEKGGGAVRKSVVQLKSVVFSQNETPLNETRSPGGRPSMDEANREGIVSEKLCPKEIEISMVLQRKDPQGDVTEDKQGKKVGRKSRKSKGTKQSKKKDKEKKTPASEIKVDFPEPLVKAHHAAYAYLNPSITKYEVLLGLLDQAAQTQHALRPMVAFMALRYEEVNQVLEEIANHGERLLKEKGEHLAWPCPQKKIATTPAKTSNVSNPAEPPPDLLQQLLQYTTQRMRLVSHSVGGIGDSALEEAVEYFSSICELLEEKLKAKRVMEARLTQILTRIEAAAFRKPGPEDSTLFSEDSGIGAESESLAGSERRRGSWESTGTIRATLSSPLDHNTTPAKQRPFRCRKASTSLSLNSVDSTCTITANELRDTESLLGSASLDDGEEDEGEDEDDEEDEGDARDRRRSNSSPPDSRQVPCRMPPRRIENPQNVEMTLKMKDAISGRINFVPSQRPVMKAKQVDNSGTVAPQWTEEEQRQPKRPQTAVPMRGTRRKASVIKQRRSRSAESLRSKAEDPTLLELERTQKDLSERLERMIAGGADDDDKGMPPKRGGLKSLQVVRPSDSGRLQSSVSQNPSIFPSQDKSGLRRHSSGEKGTEEEEKKKKEKKAGKGPLRAAPPPSTPLLLAEQPVPSNGGKNSVKRLIDTFSQGVEEKQSQGSSRLLGPLRGVRKCGIPIIPGLEDVLINENNNSSFVVESIPSDRTEDLDLDNLPPPPLEVLMDKSFERAQMASAGDNGDDVASKGRSPQLQRTTVSQRLRASVQPATVLPSRRSVRRGPLCAPSAPPVHQEAIVSSQSLQPEAIPQSEEAATLYKEARKIIHLRHAESPSEKPHVEAGSGKPSPTRTGQGGKRAPNNPSESVPSTPCASSQPPSTPPASRARMLPSTPSNPSSQHRRLPSPSAVRRQATPPSSTSPAAARELPAPPPAQRILPSPPQAHKAIIPPNSQWKAPSPPTVKREVTPNSANSTSYTFKSPSPPASPRVQRWMRDNSREETSSSITRVFSNVRSVFCPASPSLFEAQPCPVPQPPQAWASTSGCVLPRPWGEACRGRLPMSVRGPQPFIRRSQSDRRPSSNPPSRTPSSSVAQSCGSEPAINIQGLEDGPAREEEPLDSPFLRAANRSNSHPDLCIVGQALHRE